MSEYQHYEFLAVDRPLTDTEFAEVRALSTRAEMTSTHFVNDYEWGDFKGDPRTLVERYYDAHLYFANWGTRRVMLRLPVTTLDQVTADRYRVGDGVDAWTHDGSLILDLHTETEDEEWDEEDEDALSELIDVRKELAAGDLRPLYLAWLTGIGAWERDEEAFDDAFEDEPEPPVPPGLNRLTSAQRALAAFLRLDPDLLAVAAEEEAPPPADPPSDSELRAVIGELSDADREAMLLRVARGEGASVQAELLGRDPATGVAGFAPGTRRTVGALLDAAGARRAERNRPDAPRPDRG